MDHSQNQYQQQQQQQPPKSSVPIQSFEISIQNLIRSWKRRQKLELFFNQRALISQDQCHNNISPWRSHLIGFLESNAVRAVFILLLLADLTLTILELSSSLMACDPKFTKRAWYHWAGIAILGMLCAKTIALMAGLGASFFRRPGYLIDGVVLVGALLLEVFFERKGGGLLVVVSLWRLVRVVEGAFELSDEAIEAQIQRIVCQFESLKDENAKLLETIAEKDQIIEQLREECCIQ